MNNSAQALVFDAELIRRYDTAGPRYTSYPTAVQFTEDFTPAQYAQIAQGSHRDGAPLSLYFHIPFCNTVCYYCACNKVVTKDRSRAQPYLDRLYREIALQAALFDPQREVHQLHWGGGTPTFISHEQMRELMRVTGEHFSLLDNDQGEYSIELDPREVDVDTVGVLREIGFNRISLGVQDFDPQVQKAVNRIQSQEQTLGVIDEARRSGFKSVSVDLIYGLPLQTTERFALTVDKIIAAAPDRVSVFNYAHMPGLFKPQRRINENELPDAAEKLRILKDTSDRLTAAGYVYIGMDHFAKPDDELARAQREGGLYRNFQGYSTHADCDLVAMGVTSIGKVGDCYAQNARTLDDYYRHIDAGVLAVYRGVALSADDRLRRAVITRLICDFSLDYAAIEAQFAIRFETYFADELKALQAMSADGLLALQAQGLHVSAAGRLLIRNICMVFDRYLRDKSQQRFSKVI